jgi:hypothetical protein
MRLSTAAFHIKGERKPPLGVSCLLLGLNAIAKKAPAGVSGGVMEKGVPAPSKEEAERLEYNKEAVTRFFGALGRKKDIRQRTA